MDNFLVAINRVLGIEAGLVDDPNDPGGVTKWGISKRSYPNLDITNLTRDQAVALYHRDFWSVLGLDSLPLSIASQILDFAVNSGGDIAKRALQRAVGVAPDGVVGGHTLAALKSTEPHDLIMIFLAERLDFMTGCKNWGADGKGWARRVSQQLRYGVQDV